MNSSSQGWIPQAPNGAARPKIIPQAKSVSPVCLCEGRGQLRLKSEPDCFRYGCAKNPHSQVADSPVAPVLGDDHLRCRPGGIGRPALYTRSAAHAEAD